MSIVFEVSSKNYSDDSLMMKKSLSHLETLVGVSNGYIFSEPSSSFGWTFFKLTFTQIFRNRIEEKFFDMLNKYKFKNKTEKFVAFISDYFQSKGCTIRIKVIN